MQPLSGVRGATTTEVQQKAQDLGINFQADTTHSSSSQEFEKRIEAESESAQLLPKKCSMKSKARGFLAKLKKKRKPPRCVSECNPKPEGKTSKRKSGMRPRKSEQGNEPQYLCFENSCADLRDGPQSEEMSTQLDAFNGTATATHSKENETNLNWQTSIMSESQNALTSEAASAEYVCGTLPSVEVKVPVKQNCVESSLEKYHYGLILENCTWMLEGDSETEDRTDFVNSLQPPSLTDNINMDGRLNSHHDTLSVQRRHSTNFDIDNTVECISGLENVQEYSHRNSWPFTSYSDRENGQANFSQIGRHTESNIPMDPPFISATVNEFDEHVPEGSNGEKAEDDTKGEIQGLAGIHSIVDVVSQKEDSGSRDMEGSKAEEENGPDKDAKGAILENMDKNYSMECSVEADRMSADTGDLVIQTGSENESDVRPEAKETTDGKFNVAYTSHRKNQEKKKDVCSDEYASDVNSATEDPKFNVAYTSHRKNQEEKDVCEGASDANSATEDETGTGHGRREEDGTPTTDMTESDQAAMLKTGLVSILGNVDAELQNEDADREMIDVKWQKVEKLRPIILPIPFTASETIHSDSNIVEHDKDYSYVNKKTTNKAYCCEKMHLKPNEGGIRGHTGNSNLPQHGQQKEKSQGSSKEDSKGQGKEESCSASGGCTTGGGSGDGDDEENDDKKKHVNVWEEEEDEDEEVEDEEEEQEIQREQENKKSTPESQPSATNTTETRMVKDSIVGGSDVLAECNFDDEELEDKGQTLLKASTAAELATMESVVSDYSEVIPADHQFFANPIETEQPPSVKDSDSGNELKAECTDSDVLAECNFDDGEREDKGQTLLKASAAAEQATMESVVGDHSDVIPPDEQFFAGATETEQLTSVKDSVGGDELMAECIYNNTKREDGDRILSTKSDTAELDVESHDEIPGNDETVTSGMDNTDLMMIKNAVSRSEGEEEKDDTAENRDRVQTAEESKSNTAQSTAELARMKEPAVGGHSEIPGDNETITSGMDSTELMMIKNAVGRSEGGEEKDDTTELAGMKEAAVESHGKIPGENETVTSLMESAELMMIKNAVGRNEGEEEKDDMTKNREKVQTAAESKCSTAQSITELAGMKEIAVESRSETPGPGDPETVTSGMDSTELMLVKDAVGRNEGGEEKDDMTELAGMKKLAVESHSEIPGDHETVTSGMDTTELMMNKNAVGRNEDEEVKDDTVENRDRVQTAEGSNCNTAQSTAELVAMEHVGDERCTEIATGYQTISSTDAEVAEEDKEMILMKDFLNKTDVKYQDERLLTSQEANVTRQDLQQFNLIQPASQSPCCTTVIVLPCTIGKSNQDDPRQTGAEKKVPVSDMSSEGNSRQNGAEKKVPVSDKSNQDDPRQTGGEKKVPVSNTSDQDNSRQTGAKKKVPISEKSNQGNSRQTGAIERDPVSDKSSEGNSRQTGGEKKVLVSNTSDQDNSRQTGAKKKVPISEKSNQDNSRQTGAIERDPVSDKSSEGNSRQTGAEKKVTVSDKSDQGNSRQTGAEKTVLVSDTSDQDNSRQTGAEKTVLISDTSDQDNSRQTGAEKTVLVSDTSDQDNSRQTGAEKTVMVSDTSDQGNSRQTGAEKKVPVSDRSDQGNSRQTGAAKKVTVSDKSDQGNSRQTGAEKTVMVSDRSDQDNSRQNGAEKKVPISEKSNQDNSKQTGAIERDPVSDKSSEGNSRQTGTERTVMVSDRSDQGNSRQTGGEKKVPVSNTCDQDNSRQTGTIKTTPVSDKSSQGNSGQIGTEKKVPVSGKSSQGNPRQTGTEKTVMASDKSDQDNSKETGAETKAMVSDKSNQDNSKQTGAETKSKVSDVSDRDKSIPTGAKKKNLPLRKTQKVEKITSKAASSTTVRNSAGDETITANQSRKSSIAFTKKMSRADVSGEKQEQVRSRIGHKNNEETMLTQETKNVTRPPESRTKVIESRSISSYAKSEPQQREQSEFNSLLENGASGMTLPEFVLEDFTTEQPELCISRPTSLSQIDRNISGTLLDGIAGPSTLRDHTIQQEQFPHYREDLLSPTAQPTEPHSPVPLTEILLQQVEGNNASSTDVKYSSRLHIHTDRALGNPGPGVEHEEIGLGTAHDLTDPEAPSKNAPVLPYYLKEPTAAKLYKQRVGKIDKPKGFSSSKADVGTTGFIKSIGPGTVDTSEKAPLVGRIGDSMLNQSRMDLAESGAGSVRKKKPVKEKLNRKPHHAENHQFHQDRSPDEVVASMPFNAPGQEVEHAGFIMAGPTLPEQAAEAGRLQQIRDEILSYEEKDVKHEGHTLVEDTNCPTPVEGRTIPRLNIRQKKLPACNKATTTMYIDPTDDISMVCALQGNITSPTPRGPSELLSGRDRGWESGPTDERDVSQLGAVGGAISAPRENIDPLEVLGEFERFLAQYKEIQAGPITPDDDSQLGAIGGTISDPRENTGPLDVQDEFEQLQRLLRKHESQSARDDSHLGAVGGAIVALEQNYGEIGGDISAPQQNIVPPEERNPFEQFVAAENSNQHGLNGYQIHPRINGGFSIQEEIGPTEPDPQTPGTPQDTLRYERTIPKVRQVTLGGFTEKRKCRSCHREESLGYYEEVTFSFICCDCCQDLETDNKKKAFSPESNASKARKRVCGICGEAIITRPGLELCPDCNKYLCAICLQLHCCLPKAY